MSKGKKQWYLLFSLYCAVMLYLLFAREEASGDLSYWEQMRLRINLIPFRTIRRQFFRLFQLDKLWRVRHSAINLAGNVVLFVPLGIFLPKLFPALDQLWKVLAVTALIITTVELAQMLTLLGRCDIDDLILNTLGAAMGYGICKQTQRNSPS